MAGMEENDDMQTFPNEMFSLDTLEHMIQAIMTGWIGATGEEILRGRGLDSMNTTELDYRAIKSQITNESAAEAGVRDANVAQEASLLTQDQILQQSSVAALAQANAENQSLLKLL